MSEARDKIRAWLALLRTTNALKKSIDTAFRTEFGLSISRFDVLSALERAGPGGLRAGELSAQLMVTEGNTTQITAPLIRDGLVKRRAGSDARVVIFSLTRKGAYLFQKMAKAHRAWITNSLAELSREDARMICNILERIDSTPLVLAEREDAA